MFNHLTAPSVGSNQSMKEENTSSIRATALYTVDAMYYFFFFKFARQQKHHWCYSRVDLPCVFSQFGQWYMSISGASSSSTPTQLEEQKFNSLPTKKLKATLSDRAIIQHHNQPHKHLLFLQLSLSPTIYLTYCVSSLFISRSSWTTHMGRLCV